MENSRLLVGLVIGVVSLWGLSALGIMWGFEDWTERGTFGDLFGGVNALFSGLAFAGLIYTIVLQRKEIEANREEIKKANKAQRHTQRVLDGQLEQMQRTTRLTALNSLMDYFNQQITDPASSEEKVAKAREKRRETVSEIDRIINRFDDDELETME
ncbi:MAG: hypothetical protein ACO3MV_07530 [Flavobacteriales bacterium]